MVELPNGRLRMPSWRLLALRALAERPQYAGSGIGIWFEEMCLLQPAGLAEYCTPPGLVGSYLRITPAGRAELERLEIRFATPLEAGQE